jgi:hypothetical protein
MRDNKKLIVVIYVGTEDMSNVFQAIDDVRNSISSFFDKSVKLIFVPDYNNIGIKVDCINPVLLDEEEFKKVDEKLDKINKLIDEHLNDKN